MRIETIEITNYKAFHGTHLIKAGGKNLFIYGENSSGKSSLYYALKDFFQASIEDIDLNELENIFITQTIQGSAIQGSQTIQGSQRSKGHVLNYKVLDSTLSPCDLSPSNWILAQFDSPENGQWSAIDSSFPKVSAKERPGMR